MSGESTVLVRLKLLGGKTFAASTKVASSSLGAFGRAARGASIGARGFRSSSHCHRPTPTGR